MRERHEDLERLARDGHPLVHGHELEGAHVVQPVGELDDLERLRVRVRVRVRGRGRRRVRGRAKG